ncbi:hypothetical protein FRC11_013751 [Ceratobasidium sp. 423]|nr:hypothetical protein FRC11_013751 [Ceratobasidium sp. 423]
MGWFDNDSNRAQAYTQYNNAAADLRPHQADWAHELIAGPAAFEAAKAYEDHAEKNGHPPSHAKAKEILGLDFIDRERAKRHVDKEFMAAEKQAEGALSQQGIYELDR